MDQSSVCMCVCREKRKSTRLPSLCKKKSKTKQRKKEQQQKRRYWGMFWIDKISPSDDFFERTKKKSRRTFHAITYKETSPPSLPPSSPFWAISSKRTSIITTYYLGPKNKVGTLSWPTEAAEGGYPSFILSNQIFFFRSKRPHWGFTTSQTPPCNTTS